MKKKATAILRKLYELKNDGLLEMIEGSEEVFSDPNFLEAVIRDIRKMNIVIISNDSKLTVLIQTKNYGNVKGVFTLTTSNSVDIYIVCSEEFPKTLLEKSLIQEGSSMSVSMKIDVEAVESKNSDTRETQETKVNLSATNEMNPYLLLMAHSFIRQTIYLDSNAITGTDS
jgi:hypothetical protein